MADNSASFSFTLEGDKELENALDQLPYAFAKGAIVSAARTALLPVAVDAARRAPRGPDPKVGPHLADSVAISTALTRRQRKIAAQAKGVTVFVGPRVRHAHLLEFGHLAPDGSFVPPQPFMRPAWDGNRQRVLEIFRGQLWKALVRAARRLARRGEAGKLKASVERELLE